MVRARQELVRLMINAAHAFGLRVIAEGIEEPAQLDLLRRLTCDSGQGYLFARPRPADDLPPASTRRLSTAQPEVLPG